MQKVYFLLGIVFFSFHSWAQNFSITQLNQFRGQGEIISYDLEGENLFIVIGVYLEVYDISEYGDMKKIGEYRYSNDSQSQTSQIEVKDNFLFSNNGNKGLIVFDVSDLKSIRPRSSYKPSITNGAQGFSLANDFVFMKQVIGYGGSNVLLADISNPLEIEEKSFYTIPFYSEKFSISATKDYMYITAERYYETTPLGSDLMIVDISDPNNLTEVFRENSYYGNIEIAGNYLLTTDKPSILKIFEISNIKHPEIKNQKKYNKNIIFSMDDQNLVVNVLPSYGNSKYWLYKTNELPNLVPSDSIELKYDYKQDYLGLKVIDNHLILNKKSAIEIYDITNDTFVLKNKLKFVDWFTAKKVLIDGSYAYLLASNGVYIIDVTDRNNLLLKSFVEIPVPINISKDGNYIYVCGVYTDVTIIDVSDPEVPIKKGFSDSNGFGYHIFVRNDYAYIASANDDYEGPIFNEYDGFKIIDVKDKSNPKEVNFVHIGEKALAMYLDSTYVYVLTEEYFPSDWELNTTNFRVFDISDIYHPIEINSSNFEFRSRDIVVSKNIAYVASNKGLQIIDINDRLHPKLVSSINSDVDAKDISIESGIVYMAADFDGFSVIDVTNPNLPNVIIEYDTEHRTTGIDVSDNNIFIADGNSGMYIFELKNTDDNINGTTPEEFYLTQNYPNPFNPKTKIRFTIPQRSTVTLSIFTINGEKVVDLVKDELLSGIYEYEFDGSDLSSGIYFYQLKADNFIQTKKLVLLK